MDGARFCQCGRFFRGGAEGSHLEGGRRRLCFGGTKRPAVGEAVVFLSIPSWRGNLTTAANKATTGLKDAVSSAPWTGVCVRARGCARGTCQCRLAALEAAFAPSARRFYVDNTIIGGAGRS